MPIGGNADTFTITGAKLKVSGNVEVSGSIAYTTDATGFGGVTAQIDGETLNITAGKTSGVAKIERGTTANITGITHTNVSNNTTIHIALKNTSSIKGDFVTIGTFASDDNVKVNYTDEYVIGPGETGMLTLRKVNGVLSLFIREMFSSTATDTDTKPFYIKDGTNYKYPLYKSSDDGGGNLVDVTINGVQYYRPFSGGLKTKTRPPLGIPELIVTPSGNLAIGNNVTGTTVNYDVWGVPASFDFGSIYKGDTKKTSFLLENGEASGSFTESGASSGDTYSLYVDKTETSESDTISFDGFSGKTISKLNGISNVISIFNKTINYTFNTQGTGIDKVTYKIGSGTEVTTASGVYTLTYTPADFGTTTMTYAYAVDSSGNQLGTKFGPYSVTTTGGTPIPGVKRWKYEPPQSNSTSANWAYLDLWIPIMHTYGTPTPTIVSTSETESGDDYWYVYTGWIESSSTRTYALTCNADDDFYFWSGDTALDENRSLLTYSNAVCYRRYINSPTGQSDGNLSLTANVKVPIRMMFGELTGGESWTLKFDSVEVHSNLISTTVGSDTIKFVTV